MRTNGITRFFKIWRLPFLAAIFILITIPYIRVPQVWIIKHLGDHSDKIIISGFVAGILVSMVIAYFKLEWRSPNKYIKFFLIMILYYLVVNSFQNIDRKVRIVEIIHYAEYGILSLLCFRSYLEWNNTALTLSSFLLPVILMSIFGSIDESIQWILQCRVGEIRDIWMNVAAGALPQLMIFLYSPEKKNILTLPLKSVPPLIEGIVLFCLITSLFFSFAHFGSLVAEPGELEIVSRFTREQLQKISSNPDSRGKIARYLSSKNRWKLENYYVTEAMGHEGARNKSYDLKRLDIAHYEDRILEILYRPYLDAAGSRWPRDRKTECAKVAANYNSIYKSPTSRQILQTGIDRKKYWAGLVLAITLLLGVRYYIRAKL